MTALDDYQEQLEQQLKTIRQYSRISEDMCIEFTDYQKGQIAGLTTATSMTLAKVEEMQGVNHG